MNRAELLIERHTVSVQSETAARYRQYTEDLRLAAKRAHRDTQRALIDFALQYHRLADMLEADDAATTALANDCLVRALTAVENNTLAATRFIQSIYGGS